MNLILKLFNTLDIFLIIYTPKFICNSKGLWIAKVIMRKNKEKNAYTHIYIYGRILFSHENKGNPVTTT